MTRALEFLMVVGLLGLAGAAAAYLVARGYLRRRWRLLHGHVVTRAVLAAFALAAAGRDRYVASLTPEQLRRGGASRVRRRLWVAVEDAEGAVAEAAARQAPVADLPSVCRSLRSVAAELDGLLRMERRLPASTERSDGLRRQVSEVIGAARDVQAAALRAGSETTEPQVRALVRHARDEVDIVGAALSRLRSVAQPH